MIETKTFRTNSGETLSVDPYPGGIGIDVERASTGQYIATNVSQESAVALALTLLEAAGATITEVGSDLVEPDAFDADELALIEVLNRLAEAHQAATDPTLRQMLVTLGIGFVMDDSPATKAAVRALVGA